MKLTQYITSPNLSLSERRIFPSEPMHGAIRIESTDNTISNEFFGFGVAITGGSCYLLNSMEKNERRALLEYIYGKNGVNLSVGRLCIGSCDYSAELYSYDDVENDLELKHFSVKRDLEYIIPMIKEIIEVNPDIYLYAAPWSPPGWMKTSGNLCGGYMREEFLDCYADYLIRFIEEYENHGIHISAITPQNEPETQQHNSMPACVWHPDTESRFISILRKKLNAKGLDTEIWMYDYNFNNWQRPMWCLDTHKHLLNDCQAVGFHYYGGSPKDTAPIRKKYPQMKLHFTEGGPRLFDNYATDWCKWSSAIVSTLNSGFSSFVGWNLMLDENGDPNIGPHFCGGLITKNSVTGELSYSGQFKAFCHTAKFIQRGARIIECTSTENIQCFAKYGPQPKEELYCSLIENPDGTRLYVFVNHENVKKQVQFTENGQLFYAELLPDSVSSIFVEQ